MALLIPEIPIGDLATQSAVRERFGRLKKGGNLGLLEPLAVRLAAITGRTTLTFPRKNVVLVAADHGHPLADQAGLAEELLQIAGGGAPVNALARQAGATISLANVGLAGHPQVDGVANVAAGPGSKDMTRGPALGLPQVNDALLVGMNLASLEISQGMDVLVVGSVGLSGRLPALASLRVLVDKPAAELTAAEDERGALTSALTANAPDRVDPLDILRTVGGLDLAALTGLILTGAAARVPVVLDGLTAAAAALLAAYLSPAVRAFLIAGHRSGDPAHDLALRSLGLRPLIDLGLGQPAGCGGVLALHIIEAAARVLNETAIEAE